MLQNEEMKEIHMKFRSTMGTVAARREKEVELVLEILRDSRQHNRMDVRVKRPVGRPPLNKSKDEAKDGNRSILEFVKSTRQRKNLKKRKKEKKEKRKKKKRKKKKDKKEKE
jgi:hypothetical protein